MPFNYAGPRFHQTAFPLFFYLFYSFRFVSSIFNGPMNNGILLLWLYISSIIPIVLSVKHVHKSYTFVLYVFGMEKKLNWKLRCFSSIR